ncbi:hypothetical protein DWV13_05470 [Clostridium botulinum]|uniref:hypothetical protein n=1 Tax=Clostridium TaxID=1485 RepID=UPI0013FAA99E|nr:MULTISPECIES: hypothetical protein [Clostridium]MCS6131094.1 hypothetical protein [Clostridium botulinum]NFL45358.1 hypothetical protein [Clostridium botulinum]NFL90424.1 hypothetical protein [Clostridium botulinum]
MTKNKYSGYILPINSNNRKWYSNILKNKTVIAAYFTSGWGANQLESGGNIYLGEKNKIYHKGIFINKSRITINQAYNTYQNLNQLTSLGIDSNGSIQDLINLVKSTLKNDSNSIDQNTQIGLIQIELDSTDPCRNVTFEENLNSRGVYTNNIY